MHLQAERDPKNALRFYVTMPEDEVPAFSTRQLDLRIGTAEQLLAAIKKKMSEAGAKSVVELVNRSKQKGMLPSGTVGETVPHVLKRPKVGTAPPHYRVGVRVTFNTPTHATAFAQAFGIK